MPLHSGGGDAVIRRIGRRAGGDGGVDGHNTPPNPREGDFRLIPLFVGLPPLGGDALFGASFSSWQDASSLPSPMSDAAAPNVLPFALSGASPSLHARHEEQRFLFLLESFEWLHRWHGHDEARRVADRSVGILLGGDWTSRGVRHANLGEDPMYYSYSWSLS